MKTLFLSLVLSLFSLNTYSQTPSWIWAHSAGGDGREFPRGMVLDSQGNVIVVGSFSSVTVAFGSSMPLPNNWTNPYFDDMFIVKYDPSGSVLWAKRLGQEDGDMALGVALDPSGNILVTGTFNSDFLRVGYDTVFNANGSNGYNDVFILKLDPAGNYLWATGAGSTGDDISKKIVTDNVGNAYIAGTFSSPTISFDAFTLINPQGEAIFLVKYDPNGNVVWAKVATGDLTNFFSDMTIDVGSNIYFTGNFRSPQINFGSIVLSNTNATGSSSDGFVVKYDSSGNALWAKSFGGVNNESGSSIKIDRLGRLLLTGSFGSPSITLGGITLNHGNTVGTNNNGFLACLDTSCNMIWSRSMQGFGTVGASCIDVDMNNNAYVTGTTNCDTTYFGSISLINAGGFNDLFVLKYNSSGQEVWGLGVGGSGSDKTGSIAVDAASNCYLTGSFDSSPMSIGGIPLSNAGLDDFFLAKLDSTIVTEINENQKGHLSIFPNPTNDLINISLSNLSQTINRLRLISIKGEVLKVINNPPAEFKLDCKNFDDGFYYLEIETKNGIFRKTFIKM